MDEITYNPHEILPEAREEFDVESERVLRGPQVGFRTPSDGLSDRLAQDIKFLVGSRFAHSYAALEKGKARLLIIRKGSFNDPLKLDLVSMPFDKAPQYEALSYEWGDSPPVHQVILRDFSTPVKKRFQEPGKRFRFILFRAVGTLAFVRKNLFEALRNIREENRPVKLWVDALCINQRNTTEKAEQIRRMAEIYNGAINVRVWLGGASEQSDIAMEFVKELVRFEELKGVLHRQESLQKWGALIELMRSRWFSRRWVVQELALARRASVYCGSKRVAWNDFADAISLFISKLPTIKSEFESTERVGLKPQGLEAIAASGANTLVKAASNMLKKDMDGRVWEKKKTLEELVSRLTSFDAADPRDTVYGLLALARKNPQTALRPDYEKSLLEVHTDFVKYCVTTSETLDIICRHWAPVNTTVIVQKSKGFKKRVESTLPSWMQLLNESAFGTPEKIFRGRRNGVSLVGTQKVYNASGHHTAVAVRFGKTAQPDPKTQNANQTTTLTETYDGTLTAKGRVLGKIEALSPRMIPGILSQEVLSMGGWSYSLKDEDVTVDSLPDHLWRTLVANKTPSGQPATTLYRRACVFCLQREDVSGDVRMDALLADPETDEEVLSFLKRVQEVVWNRKVFTGGIEKELFGLAPRKAQEGDIVCILYGCSVPVVLRQLDKMPKLGQKVAVVQAAKTTTDTQRAMNTPPASEEGTREHEDVQEAEDASPTSPRFNPWAPGTSSSQSFETGRESLSSPTNGQFDGSEQKPVRATQFGTPVGSDSNSDNSGDVERTICYQLIGECYVDGRMDGETFDNELYDGNEQDFMLV